MAIRALDLNKVRDYICKDDDPDDPTVWKIGTLSSRDKGMIRDSVTSFSFDTENLNSEDGEKADVSSMDTKIERSKMNFEAVRRGLKGWENFLDDKGEPIPNKLVIRDVGGGVKKSVVPNDILDRIPLDTLDELAEQVMDGMSKDDGEDGKNSQGQSTGGSSTRKDTVAAAK